jgi:hypothetical protein
MVLHVKITLTIDDTLAARLEQEAVRQGRTTSELIETALRLLFRSSRAGAPTLGELPTFDGGDYLVDIDDRDALCRAMEE